MAVEAGKIKKSFKKGNIDKIIRNHMVMSMAAGAIPVPVADFVAVTAIQMDMIKRIAGFYGADFDRNIGKSLATSIIGNTLARAGASAVKALPGVGTALGISAQVLLAGATTYSLGRVFDTHFSESGSLSDFSTEKMKPLYDKFLLMGKDLAKGMRGSVKKDEIIDTISKLKKLKESGSISEIEFETVKKQLLSRI